MKSLLVYCTTSCGWKGELRSVEDHEKNKCENAKIPCPNACGVVLTRKTLQLHLAIECLRRLASCLKCEQKIEYRDLDNHMTRKCPKRQYTCPHCNEAGVYEERTTTHLETCPKVEVKCSKCSRSVLRCDESDHPSVCKNEPVYCKYYNIGCGEKPLRKDLTNHEENAQLHLSLATDKILKLTNMLVVKNTLTFKVNGFKEKRDKNLDFLSPAFCTSESGYKMCIEIYTNDYDEAKGTHVSVYACLMKGDNDDSLSWPFTGTVTIELLNQLEDKNHHKNTTTFPAADTEVSQRVVGGERGGGWGWCTFISYADLAHNPLTNTQYLKDDTLIFRVSAEAPDYKPWLECAN